MSAREPARCHDAMKWLRGRLEREGHGKHALAPLTGQDARAMTAFAHLLELYVVADTAGRDAALRAMLACVEAMQPQCRVFAKALVPWAMDWADEERVWLEIERVSARASADAVRDGRSLAGEVHRG